MRSEGGCCSFEVRVIRALSHTHRSLGFYRGDGVNERAAVDPARPSFIPVPPSLPPPLFVRSRRGPFGYYRARRRTTEEARTMNEFSVHGARLSVSIPQISL